MKHKILFAFLALATSFSLVSCGDDDKDNDPKPSKATYQDTGSELIISYPLTDDNNKVIGSCKETVSYEGETVTGYKIVASCNSATDADKTYKEALDEKENDPETAIKEVKRDGNDVIMICELPEEFSSVEMIRIMLQMQVADANGDKALYNKLAEELDKLFGAELWLD